MASVLTCYLLTFFEEFQHVSIMPNLLHVKRRMDPVPTKLSVEPLLASTV